MATLTTKCRRRRCTGSGDDRLAGEVVNELAGEDDEVDGDEVEDVAAALDGDVDGEEVCDVAGGRAAWRRRRRRAERRCVMRAALRQ